jgi:hypothetical protein
MSRPDSFLIDSIISFGASFVASGGGTHASSIHGKKNMMKQNTNMAGETSWRGLNELPLAMTGPRHRVRDDLKEQIIPLGAVPQ